MLSDSHMPDVDGFAFADQVKQDPRIGSAVVMMLTSGDRREDIARCEELGIAAYLLKPVKQSDLFDAIMLALRITEVGEKLRPAAKRRPWVHCGSSWPKTAS